MSLELNAKQIQLALIDLLCPQNWALNQSRLLVPLCCHKPDEVNCEFYLYHQTHNTSRHLTATDHVMMNAIILFINIAQKNTFNQDLMRYCNIFDQVKAAQYLNAI